LSLTTRTHAQLIEEISIFDTQYNEIIIMQC
jgi:hypothetical protein